MNVIERLYYNMDKLSDTWEDEPGIKAASDRLSMLLVMSFIGSTRTKLLTARLRTTRTGL